MKPRFSVLRVGLIAAIFATTVTAMPAGAAAEKGPGADPIDCAKAKDKARCAALNQLIRACKDKTDDEWHECMYRSGPTANFTPPKPRNCSESRNKEVCEAHAGALEACKNKHTRAEHRKCVSEQLQAASLKKN